MDRKTINRASAFLRERRLAKAIDCIRPILDDSAYALLHDRLNNITREYGYMQEYMRRGVADPSRDRLYARLLKRMHQLVSDTDVVWLTINDSYMAEARSRNAAHEINVGEVRHKLEDFVSEVAMLQFSLDEKEASRLYQRHANELSRLFDLLVLSKQWSEGEADDYARLLTAPTVEANDAALLVSALTLSCYTHFDILKFRTLLEVYQKTADEVVRQRALVGWALALRGNPVLYPEMVEMVEQACDDEQTLRQLVEMQMQMFFCLNAERDNDEIKRDILPTLMKHNNFEITRSGIVEKEEDTLEDILHPDASEKAMEEMEQTFQRMVDMQKSGSDIYFGGFSQMKRFPFFYNWTNWFCPFYLHHPALEKTVGKLKNTALLDNLLTNGPFCDSDKYSFALAMNSVIDKLSDNLKSMLGSNEVFGPAVDAERLKSPTAIRLMYLQDLYRFFRLSDRRRPFRNPFGGQEGANVLFMAANVLVGTKAENEVVRLGKFLLKRGHDTALSRLLEVFKGEDDNAAILTLRGAVLLRQGQVQQASDCLSKAHRLNPDNGRTLTLLARCHMMANRFEEAATAYAELHQRNSHVRSHLLNLCIALANSGRADEALAPLFKLNYENPEDWDVTRVLAWALLSCGKVEQASNEYRKLMADNQPTAEDCLNMGYCQWLSGHVSDAVDCFKRFVQMANENTSADQQTVDVAEMFRRDSVMLFTNGLSESSLLIMADMVE